MTDPGSPILPGPPPVQRGWALFLDVDGCLLDFADAPEDVHVPDELRDDLLRLHDGLGGALALVSGRGVAQLDGLFAPLRLPCAGLHGIELRDAGNAPVPTPAAPAALDGIRQRAAQLARLHPGMRVEDKAATLALHWRAAPEAESALLAFASAALADLPGYRLQHGNCVVELRPEGGDKGSAVERLMGSPPFAGRLPVFAGDDYTDEDGFATVNALGGLSVIVGERRPTAASHALPDPAALRRWLAAGAALLEGEA